MHLTGSLTGSFTGGFAGRAGDQGSDVPVNVRWVWLFWGGAGWQWQCHRQDRVGGTSTRLPPGRWNIDPVPAAPAAGHPGT